MSRAERRVPPAPRLGASLREAAVALYHNSWRFVAANLIFGSILLMAFLAVAYSPLGLLLVVLLIPAAAGVMRMATHYVRRGHVFFSDFLDGVRGRAWSTMGIGIAQLFIATVLAVDIGLGVWMQGAAGRFLAVVAFYGLLGLWVVSVTTWPILLDPVRDGDPLRARLRLGGLVALAHPFRTFALAAIIGVLFVASVFLMAAIITFSVALGVLAAAHYVLPAADRLEGRETVEIDDE